MVLERRVLPVLSLGKGSLACQVPRYCQISGMLGVPGLTQLKLPVLCSAGCCSFPHKMDALLWAIMLELPCDNSRADAVRDYSSSVISICSDQGQSKT